MYMVILDNQNSKQRNLQASRWGDVLFGNKLHGIKLSNQIDSFKQKSMHTIALFSFFTNGTEKQN